MRFALFFILLIFSFFHLSAQEAIYGKIVDQLSNLPLPYVTVTIKGKPVGAFTNKNGEFVLQKIGAGDSLQISMVGYAIIDTLLIPQKTVRLIVLKEKTTTLSEIEVSPLTADTIINRVCSNIEKNYPSKPSIFNALFRKQIIEDSEYSFLGNALFSITCPTYWFDETVKKKDQKFYEVKVGEVKVSQNKLEHIKITIPTREILDLMYPTFGFIVNPEYSNYRIIRKFYWNNSLYFEIWFKTKDDFFKNEPIEGNLIIDATDYALVSVTYNTIRENEKHTGFDKVNKLFSFIAKTNKYTQKVVYEKKGDQLWGLKYAQIYWDFELVSEKALNMNKKFVLISDLLVSPNNPSATFVGEHIDLDKDFFNKKSTNPTDWKEFNVIVPDYSIQNE